MKRILLLAFLTLAGVFVHAEPDDDTFYNPRLTALARFLAGQNPSAGYFDRHTSTDAWKAHRDFFAEYWTKMKIARNRPATEWRDRHIQVPPEAQGTLLYPFSGPDLLNARLFFPGMNRYVFYSLEKPGVLPDPDAMTPEQVAQLLKDIQDSLSDIFIRNYFITKHMDTELRTPYLKGNLCLFLVFLALEDSRVVSVEDMHLSPSGAPALGRVKGRVPGVRVTFLAKDDTLPRTVTYLSLDAANEGLATHPEFGVYIASLGPTAGFTKAASYLLHDPQFTMVRQMILDHVVYLMQDDSGMPYRFLLKDWTVRLFGLYTKPIKDFNYGFQPDLDKAYKSGKPEPLPFKFGYHWWDRYSNLMVAVKNAVSATAR
jgi:hypothetical protein